MRKSGGTLVVHETSEATESTLGMLREFVEACQAAGFGDEQPVRVRAYVEFNANGSAIFALRAREGDAFTAGKPNRADRRKR